MPKVKYPNGTGYEEVDYSASKVQLVDVDNLFTATDVEGGLRELKNELASDRADNVTDADGAHGLKIETGTWTPVLRGLTTAGVNTYSVQRGTYHKSGRKVTAFFAIELSAKDATMAGEIVIHGMPFITATGNDNAGSLSSIAYLGFPASRTQVGLITPPTTAFMQFRFSGSGLAMTGALPEYINNNTVLYGEITYLTN